MRVPHRTFAACARWRRHGTWPNKLRTVEKGNKRKIVAYTVKYHHEKIYWTMWSKLCENRMWNTDYDVIMMSTAVTTAPNRMFRNGSICAMKSVPGRTTQNNGLSYLYRKGDVIMKTVSFRSNSTVKDHETPECWVCAMKAVPGSKRFHYRWRRYQNLIQTQNMSQCVQKCKCHSRGTSRTGDSGPSAPPEPAQCHTCHACHTKWQSMSPSATAATWKVDVTKYHACHVKRRWMSQSATLATPTAAAPEPATPAQARHRSQPNAIRATLATQSEDTCRQVPRLPRTSEGPCHEVPRLPHKVVSVRASCVWTSCVRTRCVWAKCVWASCVMTRCVMTRCVRDKLCVSKWCGDKLCVSKLCVNKLCEDKLCEDKLVSASCVSASCVMTRCVRTSCVWASCVRTSWWGQGVCEQVVCEQTVLRQVVWGQVGECKLCECKLCDDKMCDDKMCEDKLCVSKLCEDKLVRTRCVWASWWGQGVCEQVVCEQTGGRRREEQVVWGQVGEDKVCVSKLVRTGCVWASCVWTNWREAAGGGGGGRRRRDTEPKTRTPHKDAGNYSEGKQHLIYLSVAQNRGRTRGWLTGGELWILGWHYPERSLAVLAVLLYHLAFW